MSTEQERNKKEIGKGLLPDVPVDPLAQRYARDDGLDRDALVEILTDSAIFTPDTLTVGIYGDWGSGKTSMMRLMEQHVIKATRADDEGEQHRVAVPVWFNAWQFEREEHLIIPLIATVYKELARIIEEDEKNPSLSEKLSGKLKEGGRDLLTALRATAYAFSGKVSVKGKIPFIGEVGVEMGGSAKDAIERSEELRKRYADLAQETVLERSLYFDAFEALRNASPGIEKAPKIVIFIDDLDRCLPESAVALLENIKLILDLPNFSFVLGLAPKVVERFVWKTHYEKLDFTEDEKKQHMEKYLDKFVQVPIWVPEPGHTVMLA